LIVNGQVVDDSAVRREADRLRPEYERVFADEDPQQREARLLEWSRENVIERILLAQKADEDDRPIPPDQFASALSQLKEQYSGQAHSFDELAADEKESLKAEIIQQLKIERILRELCRDLPEPSEQDLKRYYQENKQRYETPEQVRVAHIVKHIDWQADENSALEAIHKAKAELDAGAVFENVVARYSDCPDNGGDLGYIRKGQMVEEFEDVIFNLGVGETSDVFRTRFGFHIAKVYDRKPAAVCSFEQVREQIREQLKDDMSRKAIDDYIDALRAQAVIEQT